MIAETSQEPSSEARHNRGSARMFKSDFLEWFSHVHPATPAVLFLPIVTAAIVAAFMVDHTPVLAVLGCVFAGYFAWTLTEYWLHRLFFHLPVKGPITKKIYFFVHGVHHDWPWDTSRLVMPPAVSLSLGAAFYFLFGALFGNYQHALFAGFVGGYVIYDTVHWATHALAPKNRFLKHLRKQHMIHHFKEDNTRFGVSCPWWDVVFRTTGKARSGASVALADKA